MHGKVSWIHHDGQGVYRGMSNPFEATRYHSLVIQQGTLPNRFGGLAWTDQGEIMGVRHKKWPIERRPVPPRELSHRRGAYDSEEFPPNSRTLEIGE